MRPEHQSSDNSRFGKQRPRANRSQDRGRKDLGIHPATNFEPVAAGRFCDKLFHDRIISTDSHVAVYSACLTARAARYAGFPR